ncbi:hypothetical protein FRC07_002877 [Ceratobasidium sp. 392]|nr:hypothetical protein FRC07_002877 [Ceratobasidium sp. 392]
MLGLKRKRGAEQENSKPDDASLQSRISAKLHHSFKEAARAAKKAKAFEVQRAVKRLKEARQKNSGDIQDLERKLELAKELDHATLARISLARKIQKIKALAIHPIVQSALQDAAVPSLDSISNDSKHAVLSSKILASEVDRLCTGLKDLVEPPVEQLPPTKEDEEVESDENSDGGEEKEWKDVASNTDDSSDSKTSQPDPSALQSALSKLGIELDTSRPAPSSSSSSSDGEDSVVLENDDDGESFDDQASWESGSVDSEGNIRQASSVSSGSSRPSSPPAKRSKGAAEAGAGSRFLPSLASGFIRGDSDGSDIEDADVAPERKNRRGQRARKAIWEKKYGKNANHVKKAREDAAASRGRGRGRGGIGRGGASGAGRGVSSNDARGGRSGANRGRGGRVRPPPAELPTTQDGGWGQRAAKKAEEKPMHPSWIAKQKLKAKESVGTMSAQGKKIVFN